MTAPATFYTDHLTDGILVTFGYTFKCFNPDHLSVILINNTTGLEEVLSRGADYNVSMDDDYGGGDIRTVSTYASGYTIRIRQNATFEQLANFVYGSAFPASAMNAALDALMLSVHRAWYWLSKLTMNEMGSTVKLSNGKTVAWADALPTVGTWSVGDLIFPLDPGTAAVLCWRCVAAGTPGTWQDIAPSQTPVIPQPMTRSRFGYVGVATISMSAAAYWFAGSAQSQIVYWDTALSFVLGPAGSNGDSSALGTSQWQYIYIDDSVVAALSSGLLTVDCFLNSTTQPTWSGSKKGWYNGNDRCIFAVYIDGSGNIEVFFTNDDQVMYSVRQIEFALQDVDATPVDYAPRIPNFCRAAMHTAHALRGAETKVFSWAVKGTSGQHLIADTAAATAQNSFISVMDAQRTLSIVADGAGSSQIEIGTDGWIMPVGL